MIRSKTWNSKRRNDNMEAIKTVFPISQINVKEREEWNLKGYIWSTQKSTLRVRVP
jgi:hypothetical protein